MFETTFLEMSLETLRLLLLKWSMNGTALILNQTLFISVTVILLISLVAAGFIRRIPYGDMRPSRMPTSTNLIRKHQNPNQEVRLVKILSTVNR